MHYLVYPQYPTRAFRSLCLTTAIEATSRREIPRPKYSSASEALGPALQPPHPELTWSNRRSSEERHRKQCCRLPKSYWVLSGHYRRQCPLPLKSDKPPLRCSSDQCS